MESECFNQIQNLYYRSLGFSGLQWFLTPHDKTVTASTKRILIVLFYTLILPILIASRIYYSFFCSLDLGHKSFSFAILSHSLMYMVTNVYFLTQINTMRNLILDPFSFPSVQKNSPYAIAQLTKTYKKLSTMIRSVYFVVYVILLLWLYPLFEGILYRQELPRLLPFVSYKCFPEQYAFLVLVVDIVSTLSYALLAPPISVFLITAQALFVKQVKIVIRSHSQNNFEDMNAFIKEHQMLLRKAKDLKSVLNPIVGLKIGDSLVSLCSHIYQATRTSDSTHGIYENLLLITKHVTTFTHLLSEVLIYCAICSRIKTAEESIGEALYNSRWYEKSLRDKKKILLALKRSQNSTVFKAAGLVKTDLSTFIDVLQFSYSYYTLLREFK